MGTEKDEKESYINIEKEKINKLTNWKNEPTLLDLQNDYKAARIDYQLQMDKIDNWKNVLEGRQVLKVKPGRSKIIPKLVRKQAEWRYSALAEPFLSTDDLFMCSPRTFEDSNKATHNSLILNYQFNCVINKTKFIDDLVRTVVNEGTAIIQTGWEFEEDTRKVYVDIIEEQPIIDPSTGQPIIDPATGQFVTEQTVTGQEEKFEKIVVKNQPTVQVCDYKNIIIDPTCNGNIEDARFVINVFETSLAELRKEPNKYKNLEHINVDFVSIYAASDSDIIQNKTNFTYKDTPRKRIIAREYWGYWDINDTGTVEPIVATWVGDVLIRMESNPFPDKKPPFVVIPYLPVKDSVYGEPDAALLEDNQKIIGAVTRGIIDIIGRSANGQQGIRKDALDFANAKKFESGEDYKFNANIDPKQAFHMETYPEIPRSAMEVIQMQNNEAESLTGIKAFASGISGNALGVTATSIRSALDATAKRELGVLRRISNGLTQLGRKIISMNSEFLDDKEIIRITNEELIEIDRNDLGGKYDIRLKISTAEADEQKAQELSFMLQTMGNKIPLDISKIILIEIARLRKMPELAKNIEAYTEQPDPIAQEKAMLENELLKAQIANLYADAQDKGTNAQLRGAKTVTEGAKARQLDSSSDLKDLDFVEKESGVNRAHEERMAELRHNQEMQNKEHQRLSDLDKIAFSGLNSKK